MSGIELVRALTAEGLVRAACIVSAYRDFEYARQAMELGSCCYLLKPLAIGEVEHAAEMLRGLKEDLGLYLAAVSNTGSLFGVFDVLKQYGIREFFDDVTLSSIVSYRKPHPYIFRIAIEQSGFRPEECAFVGDTLSRDVVGPRKVGYGKIFKINSFLSPLKDIGKFDVAPDYEIEDIYEVYEILKKELGK